MTDGHLLALDSEWGVWPALRARVAGMPFDWLDIPVHPDAAGALAAAEARVAAVAAEPAFQEAVLWQNPQVVHRIGAARRTSARRRLRNTLWAYATRYCAKNDTIGFFGPVIWGRWSSGGSSTGPVGGPPARRATHFELWAVRAVADAIEARHGLTPWTVPQLAPAVALTPAGVRLSDGSLLPVDTAQQQVLRHCDGRRTGIDVAAACEGLTATQVAAEVSRLRTMGVLTTGFPVRRDLYPERHLRGQLLRVGDPARRAAALGELNELVSTKQAVQDAAGDPDLLSGALQRLDQVFERVAARPAVHRQGQFYAGRTPVYEDCLTDVEMRLGTDVLHHVAPVLSLLLASARWLSNATAAAYDRWLTEVVVHHAAGHRAGVPVAVVLAELTATIDHAAPSPADEAAAELRRRWADLLGVGHSGAPVHRRSADLRAGVRRLFATGEPRWPLARVHSPDLMFAARSAEELVAGRFTCVLGELHPAYNTVANLLAADAYHPDPDSLHAWIDADITPSRIVPLYPLGAGMLNSRTAPPDAYLSDGQIYLGVGQEAPYQPAGARTLPVAELVVRVEAGEVVVCSRDGTFQAPASRVFGEYLSMAVGTRFGLLPPAPHRPRVLIDGMVVVRESWRMPFTELPAADQPVETLWDTWRATQRRLGCPRHVFAAVDGQRKPFHIDFANPVSIAVLAGRQRRSAERAPAGAVTFTEMLPGPDDLWLSDRQGRRHTAEFRFVCVDRRAS